MPTTAETALTDLERARASWVLTTMSTAHGADPLDAAARLVSASLQIDRILPDLPPAERRAAGEAVMAGGGDRAVLLAAHTKEWIAAAEELGGDADSTGAELLDRALQILQAAGELGRAASAIRSPELAAHPLREHGDPVAPTSRTPDVRRARSEE